MWSLLLQVWKYTALQDYRQHIVIGAYKSQSDRAMECPGSIPTANFMVVMVFLAAMKKQKRIRHRPSTVVTQHRTEDRAQIKDLFFLIALFKHSYALTEEKNMLN